MAIDCGKLERVVFPFHVRNVFSELGRANFSNRLDLRMGFLTAALCPIPVISGGLHYRGALVRVSEKNVADSRAEVVECSGQTLFFYAIHSLPSCSVSLLDHVYHTVAILVACVLCQTGCCFSLSAFSCMVGKYLLFSHLLSQFIA